MGYNWSPDPVQPLEINAPDYNIVLNPVGQTLTIKTKGRLLDVVTGNPKVLERRALKAVQKNTWRFDDGRIYDFAYERMFDDVSAWDRYWQSRASRHCGDDE